MQTQDAPAEFLFKLYPWLEKNKNALIGGVVAVIVISGIFYFVSSQRAQKEIDAGHAFTTLLVTPTVATNDLQMATSMQQLAANYAGTAAAQRAQLQSAASLFEAGNFADAQTQFQKYLDANPAGQFAATAQLGVATCLEAQNKIDQAVSAYQRVLSAFSSSTSVAPAEFALGRIAEQQGKLTEAMSHFENVMRSPLGGTLASEAKMHAYNLQAKIAAAAPKPSATPAPATTPGFNFSPAPTQQTNSKH